METTKKHGDWGLVIFAILWCVDCAIVTFWIWTQFEAAKYQGMLDALHSMNH